MILTKVAAWHASVALRKKFVVISLVAFHTNTLSRTIALFGLPFIRETVTGIPSGSTTSIGSWRASCSTAKYSVVGENVGGRLTNCVKCDIISNLLHNKLLCQKMFRCNKYKTDDLQSKVKRCKSELC